MADGSNFDNPLEGNDETKGHRGMDRAPKCMFMEKG